MLNPVFDQFVNPPLPILPTALRTPQAGWNRKVPSALAHKAGSHVQRNYTGPSGRPRKFQILSIYSIFTAEKRHTICGIRPPTLWADVLIVCG